MNARAYCVALLLAGCGGGPGGKLMVDTPVLPYQAPDIDEITGIDSEAEEAPKKPAAIEAPKASTPAAAVATQPAAKPAVTPTPAPPTAAQKPATPPAPAKK